MQFNADSATHSFIREAQKFKQKHDFFELKKIASSLSKSPKKFPSPCGKIDQRLLGSLEDISCFR